MKKIGNISPAGNADIEKQKDAWEYARWLGLDSLRRRRREHAEETIRQLGPGAVPFLLSVIEEDKSRFARRTKGLITGAFASISTYVIFGFLTLHASIAIKMCQPFLLFPTMCFKLCLLMPSRMQNRAVVMLADSADDIAHVPAMLDAIENLTGQAQKTVRASLTDLLPKITQAEGRLITEKMREGLRTQLDKSRTFSYYGEEERADYIAAIIRCLEALGDERAYPIVKELAGSLYLNGAGARIRLAAKSAVPFLERRYERSQIAGSLLRPSETPTNADSLVRPAANSAPKDDLLLTALNPSYKTTPSGSSNQIQTRQ